MRVLQLKITNFRGIRSARIVFGQHTALVGPTGCGKSTLVDALSLVFGRQKLVRDLTEHDFAGSTPGATDRIRIAATIGDFPSNRPDKHPEWFHEGRAIERWWNPEEQAIESRQQPGSLLCVEIGFAARFDQDELVVEQRRFFADDDDLTDPFIDDAVALVPLRLLSDVGFYVLPARRTWPSTISFGSELFRRAVATAGGLPAASVLAYRDQLRSPTNPFESDAAIAPLISRIDSLMAQLLPGSPRLHLRITATDSDSVLQSLIPHYSTSDCDPLPAGRHGTGLLAMQTLVLLLEIGRARKEKRQSFILALEEPELHIPPGLQRRLVGEASIVSSQVLCTTHSPRVASMFDPSEIVLLSARDEQTADGDRWSELAAKPLKSGGAIAESNAIVQLYTDHRSQLVEALMAQVVLVPEGRCDFEWLRLLLDIVEMGDRSTTAASGSTVPPFGSIVGCVPTRNAAVIATCNRLSQLHRRVIALVDGDVSGDGYVDELLGSSTPPPVVIQWPQGLAIEDVITRCVAQGPTTLMADISQRLERPFAGVEGLREALQNADGRTGGLKTHYSVHEEISAVLKQQPQCVAYAHRVLCALTRAVLPSPNEDDAEILLDDRSTQKTRVLRVAV